MPFHEVKITYVVDARPTQTRTRKLRFLSASAADRFAREFPKNRWHKRKGMSGRLFAYNLRFLLDAAMPQGWVDCLEEFERLDSVRILRAQGPSVDRTLSAY